MTYPSPCVSVCKIDPATGWCRGCRRTRDEIRRWRDASDDERQAIADRAKIRAERDAS